MLLGAITLFLIALCYGGSIEKKVITSILICVCQFTAETIVASILILSDMHISDTGYNGNAFSYILSTIIFWMIYRFIKLFKNINTELTLPTSFTLIVIFFSMILIVMEMIILPQESISKNVKIISAIGMLMAVFLVIYLYDVISKYYTEKLRFEIIEREKNYYMKQAELLEKNNKGIRNLRHDIVNHLYAISAMVDDTNEDVKTYIHNIINKDNKDEIYSSTGNVALDSIINYKLSGTKEQNIQVNVKITIPNCIKEGIEDLIAIIGNLLDNAIEALKMVEEDKYIDLKMKYKSGAIFIEVKNKYNGIVNQKNGRIITKKVDKKIHGIGLESVRAAVSAHNGIMEVDFDDKEFRVSVMIYLSIETDS